MPQLEQKYIHRFNNWFLRHPAKDLSILETAMESSIIWMTVEDFKKFLLSSYELGMFQESLSTKEEE